MQERFPGSGLGRVADELLAVSREVRGQAERIARPRVALRVTVWAAVAALVLGLVVVPFALRVPDSFALPEFVALTEAGMNILVLVGGAVLFLVTTERRLRRRQVLAALHELRSLAHVVDMHQLTKDPQRTLDPHYTTTASSPREPLSVFELSRYLDYCSELLSLTGKIAAVYVQHFEDSEAVSAANDVEDLCTALSRKIWQKIMILQGGETEAAVA